MSTYLVENDYPEPVYETVVAEPAEDWSSRQRRSKLWLILGTALMLLSMIGTHLVQTGGGRIEIKNLAFETNMGVTMAGRLFVPPNATAETPAPAVIVSHGMFNNHGMQDLNFVELARRGFVVFAMDMFSHGDSGTVPATGQVLQSMNQAVMMIDRINYVDSSRIGISGHSLGGMSSNIAVAIDNGREVPLIRAVVINSANAEWNVDGEFGNHYGNRDVAIIAPRYEEFFMLDTDAAGNVTSPTQFMVNNNAQSFLHFGANPASISDLRQAGTMYRQNIDGHDAIRVIYDLPIIHPWAHFSSAATEGTIDFFEAALGAPNPIAPSNQIWQWKVVFNTLGLIGIGMFLVNFVNLMTFTPSFASLRARNFVEPRPLLSRGGNGWFYGSLALGALFGTLVYLPIMRATDAFRHSSDSFAQTAVFGTAMWALITGLFALLMMAIYYFAYGRRVGMSFADLGFSMNLRNLGKTLLLALIAVTVFFGWVFFADYFFNTDFRLWVVAIRTFSAARVVGAIFPYLLMFLVFFVANSMAQALNYNTIGGRKWVNTLLFSLFNVLPALILLLIQYVTLFSSGWLFFGDHAAGVQGPYHMFVVWLFPFLLILTVTPIISRKIYRMTNNPYLGGIINAIIVTMMAAANTLTWAVA